MRGSVTRSPFCITSKVHFCPTHFSIWSSSVDGLLKQKISDHSKEVGKQWVGKGNRGIRMYFDINPLCFLSQSS